ncbi:MAG TPA: Tim44-like domain-containing protein [Burkholderiales bacterium]
MSKWLLVIAVSLLGAMLAATDADAKRIGGGRSVGTQRSITAPPPASTPARPAQQQAAPQNGAAPQQPAPASGFSRWLPMLGGLAIGGLLGSMFGGSGLGGIFMLALLGFAAVFVIRALMARRQDAAPQALRAAGMESEPIRAAPPTAAGASRERAQDATSKIPPGFDTAGFLRSAKLNFVRLQVANDLGKLDEIRELTTQEMFDELRKDVAERPAQQQTDVVTVDADLLELATERDQHWASVRFSGMVREAPGAAPEGFEEVWNLVKPADGSSGWLLAGIQQMH